jgi:nicotinamide mononucleotide transporter
MTTIEILATALGLMNVWLIVKRSMWNYPPGLVMVALYAWIFYDAKLYSDVILQIFFFFVQLYGWYNWKQSQQESGEVVVESMSLPERTQALVAVAIFSIGLGGYMSNYTDASLPHWDAFIAGASFVAQYLLSKRKLENWVLWITVDVVAIGVYAYKGLYITSGLYSVFLGMATIGLITWYQTWRTNAREDLDYLRHKMFQK